VVAAAEAEAELLPEVVALLVTEADDEAAEAEFDADAAEAEEEADAELDTDEQSGLVLRVICWTLQSLVAKVIVARSR
jgi:hypothetical protein